MRDPVQVGMARRDDQQDNLTTTCEVLQAETKHGPVPMCGRQDGTGERVTAAAAAGVAPLRASPWTLGPPPEHRDSPSWDFIPPYCLGWHSAGGFPHFPMGSSVSGARLRWLGGDDRTHPRRITQSGVWGNPLSSGYIVRGSCCVFFAICFNLDSCSSIVRLNRLLPRLPNTTRSTTVSKRNISNNGGRRRLQRPAG